MEMDLPEGATLGDLWDRLLEQTPALSTYHPPPLMARNQEYAPLETVLKEGEEVALLPPVSGG